MFIAHKRDKDGEVHNLFDHLKSTAQLAGDFAKSFNAFEFAYICGLLHDIGKYSDDFQRRILYNGKKCDHSTAGAKEAEKLNGFGRLLSYCIAGHHSGLPNAGYASDNENDATLKARLSKKIPDYTNAFNEIEFRKLSLPNIPKVKPFYKFGFSFSFYIRMIYSCLTDSDFLDTERFMSDGKVDREVCYDFQSFLEKLNLHIEKFDLKGKVNEMRRKLLSDCIKKSDSDRGLFTLTVPTGGGKTLSSLSFAINHLIRNNMERIIYVIPYTSIIEQNAGIFKDILGSRNVLEHHSNFDFTNDENDVDYKIKLSSENWNMPIIVTTNVQFFESLFANKSSRCRKLHNICNSVIVLDEAQMLPFEYLKPSVMAISELVTNYNSTVVLCTATQPALDNIFPEKIKIREISDNVGELYNILRRTRIIKRGLLDLANLSCDINTKKQVLCVVNTRKHAYELYLELKGEGVFHLSTLMCPNHRRKVISDIKERLVKKQDCKVVSTRLVEAGVDVDFPIVYRSMAGLDSIIQAAGRCNREGKLMNNAGDPVLGEVHVFTPEVKYTKHQPESFKGPIRITESIIRNFEDIFSPEAVYAYFKELYEVYGENSIDIHNIFNQLDSGVSSLAGKIEFDFFFKDIADKFRLIDEDTYPIIIAYSRDVNDRDSIELLCDLRESVHIGPILRSLQSYIVNVYKSDFDWLYGANKLEVIKDSIYVLRDMSLYDNETGFRITRESGMGIYV